ncbi:MAG: DUF4261 domain-containing protein [Oscillospiraceae bacterium]|nr:DUF4261 domain-containing protein [Oscillospiraceae bacterium]
MGLFEKGKEKENEKKGSFVGFVLLSDTNADMKKLSEDLGESLGIDVPYEKSEKEGTEALVADHKGCHMMFGFMPMPVPNGEAEYYAECNYMWKNGVDVVKKHKAQIIVGITGNGDVIETGKIFVKAVLSALRQENAIAFYSDGAVHEPNFYREAAKALDKDDLPILNWIWFGVYSDEKQRGIYTFGMKNFGKDEMEIYADGAADINEIRIFAADIVYYILSGDVTLRDGETIGMSAEQKLPITRSKGIALDGETLKIKYSK